MAKTERIAEGRRPQFSKARLTQKQSAPTLR